MAFGRLGSLGRGYGRMGGGGIVSNDPSIRISSNTIPEDTATTTAVFTASVSGVYTGTPTYTLGGTDDASFSIDTNTGVVTLDQALDYETDPSLSIDITVADIVPLPAVNPRTFTIIVTDVAEGGGAPAMQFNVAANSQLLAVLEDF